MSTATSLLFYPILPYKALLYSYSYRPPHFPSSTATEHTSFFHFSKCKNSRQEDFTIWPSKLILAAAASPTLSSDLEQKLNEFTDIGISQHAVARAYVCMYVRMYVPTYVFFCVHRGSRVRMRVHTYLIKSRQSHTCSYAHTSHFNHLLLPDLEKMHAQYV